MTRLLRSAGLSGALFSIKGTVANNATWAQDIYFFEAGVAMDISTLDWKMTFRADPNQDNADLTLSIDDATLSIELDSNNVSSILRITAPPSRLSGYIGDYITDLASNDTNDVVTLWVHGVTSFVRNPVTF